MFGIFTEAPLIFLVTAMLAVLPLGRRRGWGHAWAAAALVPLMVLSRQVPVLPLGMVLGGWLWATVRARSVKNDWLPFVATVVPTALVVDVVEERWAPFDPLQVLRTFTHGQTLGELLRGATPCSCGPPAATCISPSATTWQGWRCSSWAWSGWWW